MSALRNQVKSGGLKIPEGVVRELERGTDRLGKFVREQRGQLEVTAWQLPGLRPEVARLERLYGQKIRVGSQEYVGFWRSSAGRKSADAQVVAVAKLLEGVAVSDDRAVKLVCALEGVQCIGWSEFARRLGLIKPQQLDLDFGSGAKGGG